MLRLLWVVIAAGNPAQWAALALAVTLALGGSFGAGALWQAQRTIKTALAAAPIAAKAQHAEDVKRHNTAVQVDSRIRTDDAARDRREREILAALAALPAPPEKTCDLPQDVVELLNDAGR